MAVEKTAETWRNMAAGRVVLKHYNQRGELGDMMVQGGRTFNITPQERRINQEMSATEALDMFKNGMLSPVKLIDSEEDTKEIASNPNLMGETEMAELFSQTAASLKKRLTEINNPVTLQRMLEIAVEEDAAQSKVQAVKDRLVAVSPHAFVEVETQNAPPAETKIKPITPR